MRAQAAKPSESWLALPAVMKPSSPMTGGSFARPSALVEGRLHSSMSMATSCLLVSPVSRSTTILVTLLVTISSAKRPASWAAAVRRWLWREYSSWASREMS